MFQVYPEHYASLQRFFTDPPPNAPMVQAFLRGKAPGRAFIDDADMPRGCVVAMNYRFVFFGGVPSGDFQERALQRLRREHALHLVWNRRHASRPPGPRPDREVARVEFRHRDDPDLAKVGKLRRLLPAHAEIRRIDASLLQRCAWREDVLRATGSASEFLAHGVGFCVLIAGEIAAEAYSCVWGGDRVEIAVVTQAKHRGCGLATAVCAELIHACEGLGLSTYWSCDADNEPSLRLAARLGYADPREYRLLCYDRLPIAIG